VAEFLEFATIVRVSDAFLKPFLLGRDIETPMLVILIGAIGGAVMVWRTKAKSS
jgi:predicted PurR-regulated permease PerM